MTNPIATALRAAARAINAQADAIDAQGANVTTDKPILIQWGDEFLTPEQAEERRRQEIAERGRPHDWVELRSGVLLSDVGDNDKPDDALFRDFGPFMEAATRNDWKDSTGERFSVQSVKRRANAAVGFGPPAWAIVRAEVNRLLDSDEGRAWCADAANIAAGIVPKGRA